MNTVLIVEDEKLIRQGIRAMIQRAPVSVAEIIECKNGEEALEVLRSRTVDVMFTDIRMPKMDGIALIRAMQELPSSPLTVVISGFDDFSYAVEVLRHGVRDYLLKPVERQQVYDILTKLEEELQAQQRASQNTLAIGQQVLRSLMLSGDTTPQHMQAILEQYSALFLQEPYCAVCMSPAGDDTDPWPSAFALRYVDGHDILLLTADMLRSIDPTARQNRCAGISAMHQGLETLYLARAQATKARRRAFVLGKTQRHTDAEEAESGEVPYAELEKIVQLLGAGNEKEAKGILGEILLKTQKGQLSPERFVETMQQLVSKIRVTYRKILTTEESIAGFADVWSYGSMFDYYTALCEWMDGFSQYLTKEFDDYHNKQKIQQALDYIRQHYHTGMNMATVSNHVSMNYSLFSYLFKQYIGTNFVTYLQNLRIEESKRLLAETDWKVHEISAKVGFQNEKHFMKLFKAVCGISPSEYRRTAQLKES